MNQGVEEDGAEMRILLTQPQNVWEVVPRYLKLQSLKQVPPKLAFGWFLTQTCRKHSPIFPQSWD